LTLGRRRIFIPGFLRFPPTLAVYDVAHSLPLGGVIRGFSFTEDEIGKHFLYISGTFRELWVIVPEIIMFPTMEEVDKWYAYGFKSRLIRREKTGLFSGRNWAYE
jgi:hypothetical protein